MESTDNLCLVCHEHIDFFAIGKCDHPICFRCSTRMRALCEQFYCPICRTDLPEVFFLKTREKFGEMPIRKFIMNRKLKIQFEDDTIRERFEELLEHRCTKCKDRYPERNFKALRDHMRRVHTLFYCDLCLELKIFSSERKAYNRHDLATHRRVGDKDDKSYKGHPLCQFCEERYLDKDELYKHLRKDHFFCHFCESHGSQEFYNDYSSLRGHFATDHYLCEEGECASAQFTNAFRSDIDLKSHQAQEHSKAQTKLQARQERTINIDINYAPRPNSRPQRGREPRRDENEDGRRGGPRNQGNRGGRGGNKYTNNYTSHREKQDIDRAIQASLSTMKDVDMKKEKPKADSSSSSEDDFARTEEHFPALGAQAPVENNVSASVKSQATVSTTTTSTSVSTATSDSKPSLADRFAMSNSMSVQHGGLNDFPTLTSRSDSPINSLPAKGRGAKFTSTFKAKNPEEDFPDLPSSNKSSFKPLQTGWTQPEKKINVIDKPATKRPNISGSTDLHDSLQIGNDTFSQITNDDEVEDPKQASINSVKQPSTTKKSSQKSLTDLQAEYFKIKIENEKRKADLMREQTLVFHQLNETLPKVNSVLDSMVKKLSSEEE